MTYAAIALPPSGFVERERRSQSHAAPTLRPLFWDNGDVAWEAHASDGAGHAHDRLPRTGPTVAGVGRV
jgi:hypothetical protein